ncbi:MAG: dTDP-4-dehydrorhamnose 3,5-epimerase [Porphyromonas sp.]|nr:dTDP-4-dehydrorhamnose 3,5-epimerase [Porphyromonas sp.]
MNIIKTETSLPGVYIIETKRFKDPRGHFSEIYNEAAWADLFPHDKFVQDNESYSHYGVFRGLHSQQGDAAQSKLVRVVSGKIIDFVVDIDPHSPTYCKFLEIELSSENGRQLYIPRKYAHGFLALDDRNIVSYKVDRRYAPESEKTFRFDDPKIGLHLERYIDLSRLIISEKDLQGSFISE